MLKVCFTENSQVFAICISIRREKRGGLAPLDRRTRSSGAGVPLSKAPGVCGSAGDGRFNVDADPDRG
jgi:hypothetical protein